MNFHTLKSARLIYGLIAGGFFFLFFCLPQLASAYSFDLSLSGGESAASAELSSEIGNWEVNGGEFVSDGYLLSTSSLIRLKLPNNLPVGHVKIRFEAKGIDNDVKALPAGAQDGYMFSLGNEWCNPCPQEGYNQGCDAANFGVSLKKWPANMGGDAYSNSILAQGWSGLFNGTAVPGAGVGDQFNWEDYTGFYTVELDLHAGSSSGTLSVWKGDPNAGAAPVLNSPSGVPYGLLKYDNRDDLKVGIGAEAPGEPSYGGVTIRNVSLLMEEEAAPAGHPTYPTQCANEDPEDNIYGVCSCVGGSLSDPVPCEDTYVAGDKRKATVMNQFPFEFDHWKIAWDPTWTIKSMMKEFEAKDKETQMPASVEVQFTPPSPKEGDQAGAVATALNFRTRPNNLYYAWCLVDGDRVWPMNSVVAGGTRPENASDKPFDEKGCCGPITRTPTVDKDNDGMDDNWEIEKFIGRAGTNYTSIEEVRPGDDPDSDGFKASNFKNENGQTLTVAPGMRDSKGNGYVTGQTGSFANIEEYIAGTDPLNGDTDGDGFGDEMDYVGVGQSNLPFDIEKSAGPNGYYDVGVSVVGIDSRKKTALTSSKQRIFIGDDDQLEVTLDADKEVLTFGSDQSLVIQADTIAGSETNRILYYEWSLNGDSACDKYGYENEDLCDVGKDELKIGAGGISPLDLPAPTSEDYTIGVKVRDQASRDEAEATLVLPVAYAVTLTTVCNGQTQEINSLPVNSGDTLGICIAEIDEITAEMEAAKLNFVWSYDGVNVAEQSGLGKTQFTLVADGDAGATHTVAVRIKDPNRAREFANGSRQFGVGGPRVSIVEPADRITFSDQVVPGETRFIAVRPGEKLPLGANQENFIGTQGWVVNWQINGAAANSYTLSTFEPGEKHLFTFDVPAEARDGQVYTINFSITAIDNDPPESASDSIKVVVGPESGVLGRANPFFSTMAAVFNQVPEIFRQLITYAGILAAVFFALVFLYPKVSRFLENRQSKK